MVDWDGRGLLLAGGADGDGDRAGVLAGGVAAAACAAWDRRVRRELCVTAARTVWLTVTVG